MFASGATAAFEDPRPLLNAFFKRETSTPRFYTGLKKGDAGLKKGETGMESRVVVPTERDKEQCLMLDQIDAVTLAASLVDSRGGLRAAAQILEEALATVRAEIAASDDGSTNEWRAYFAERPSKGPQFFDRLSDKKSADDTTASPKIYTGM